MSSLLVYTENSGLIGYNKLAGLSYFPEIINEEIEKNLLNQIDALPWSDDLKRRVQHYGYKYDYTHKRIHRGMKTDSIPSFLRESLWEKVDKFFVDKKPDQVIINEYKVGQKIAPHVDCVPCFDDTIVSFSLETATVMVLTHVESNEKIQLELQPRSVLVLKDKARYDWRHGIPNQLNGRRVSITWRKVKLESA